MRILLIVVFAFLGLSAFSQEKKNDIMIDSITSYNSILFEKEVYTLVWSHSNNGYYKQEYIRAKDKLDKFNKMITIDVLITNLSPKDVIAKKIREIEARKGKDPVANYQIIENEQAEEFLLDFVMSEGNLYEWNAYRYKTIKTNKGKAVLLFAYTFRSFQGAELKLDDFFSYLKKNRSKLIESVAYYTLPAITLRN
jgi:hypothetical protein